MPIVTAEAEIRELREKVQRWQGLISGAQTRISDLETYVRIARELDGVPADNPTAELQSRDRAPESEALDQPQSRPAKARRLAVDAVRQAGRALRTRDLVELMRAHGLTFGYGDPKLATADLSGVLGRDPLLRNAGRGVGWVLTEWGQANSAADVERLRSLQPEHHGPSDVNIHEDENKFSGQIAQSAGALSPQSNHNTPKHTAYGIDFTLGSDYDPFQEERNAAR